MRWLLDWQHLAPRTQLSGEEGDKARRKIENFLAGALTSDRPTHTM